MKKHWFVVKKYVQAVNVTEAIRLSKDAPVLEVMLDDSVAETDELAEA
jgi:hypothetical protein